MDIIHLIYFKEIVEQESLSKAAQRLFITQPAISASLAKVENEVGTKLFERDGRKLTINKSGKLFYESVCRIISELQYGKRMALSAAQGKENTISITAFTFVSFSTVTIPFLAKFPEATFRLSQNDGDNIAETLASGEIDFAFSCYPTESDQLNCIHLMTQKLFITIPHDHPLVNKTYLKLSDVKDEPFILMHRSSQYRTLTDKLFSEAGFTPHVAYELTTSSLMSGMINAGEGISLLPDTFSEHPFLTKINVSSPNCIHNIYLIWPKGKHLSQAAENFLDFITHYYKDYPK